MASDDFSIKTKITLDTKNYEAGIKKAESATQKFSSSLSGVTKLLKSTFAIAGISVGTKAIVNFGKEAVKSAERATKTLNILNNTLKVTGASAWTTSEDLVKMSEEIAYSTNYTVGEIQDMQSVLLGFKNITGDTFREASDAITDMATVMGMDLKSAVQTVGKALDDPIKGLDSLKRQGFAFTDQQKEEMKVLVENGEILKAQNMILEELNTTYGGAAQAAQSGFDKQKDAIIEFKETIGNQLMPIMEKWSAESGEAFGKLTELVQRIDFASIAAGFEIVVDTIKDIIITIWTNLKELFSGLESIFNDDVNLFDWWKDAIWNALNNVYRIVQDCFGLIKALINGDWKVAWAYAKLTVMRVIDTILDNLSRLMNAFPTVINKLIDGLNELIKGINQVKKILGMEQFDLIKPFKSVDLSALTGLEDKIKEVEKEIEDATGHAADKAIKDMGSVEDRREKYIKESRKENLDLINTSTTTIKKSNEAWDKFYSDLEKKAKDWASVNSEIYSTMMQAFGDTFTKLGENLVGAGNSYEDFAAVALNALAQVLQSLGAQLAALAAVKAMAYSYGEAAVALAASSAAFVASGVASGMAKQLSAVGTSADKAGKSLKYFNDRLREIKEGLTNTTRNLVYNVTQLRSLSKQAEEAAEERLKQYETERDRVQAEIDSLEDELRNHYSETSQQIRLAKINSLYEMRNKFLAEYNELVEKSNELNAESSKVLRETLQAYNAQILSNKNTIESYKELYTVTYKISEFLKAVGSLDISYLIQNFMQLPELMQYYQVVLLEQKDNIQKTLTSLYESLSKTGQTIGESIIDSLVNGVTKSDFLISMKDYIRENLLKLAVYTESFQGKLAEIGVKLNSALLGGGSIKDVRTELEQLWEEASKNAEKAESIISDAFGDLQESIEETGDVIETVEKKLTKFEQLVESFKETVSDLGGDIATNLVDGISSGLSQSEFLDNMKKWIRKMLVQSVVYTESMKAEIEAIGQAISKGISEGFTETSFHEIRRDLSWVFNQANQTIEGIDNILNSVFGGGYATGTNNATSGLHLVGEAGPELVKFRGGEQVLNNRNTNKALAEMGGKTINQNITFNNLQDTTAYAMMNQLKQYNRQMAINGVI